MIDDLMKAAAELTDKELESIEAAEKFVPKLFTFYMHSGKDDNYYTGAQLGLIGEALDNFRYAGYEVEFQCMVHADGSVTAISVNGVPLAKPTKL